MKLRITAQFGPASILESIYATRFDPPKGESTIMCVCVCGVCVFIKLHITAQSGPVILVIICHTHWSSQRGINDTYYENL